MGLINNPELRTKFIQLLKRHNGILCIVAYISGILWFFGYASIRLNARTYFSENALLPGLVEPEFYHHYGAVNHLKELKDVMRNSKSSETTRNKMPYQWLMEKFTSVGLPTYIHNYTFHHPAVLTDNVTFSGHNVYAVLRAPRASSTEAIVLSAPYRPPESSFHNTHVGIALMLGLASAFRRKSYWAKDIIFLITENEHIGMQAWLDAYHYSSGEMITTSELLSHSGAIQAAINIEIGHDSVSLMDIKIEGLNGQMPNLDLVNTAVRLCKRENLVPTLNRRSDYWNPDSMDGFMHALKTMMLMMWNQARGSPTGNHGLFHQYGIEAITLHSIKLKSQKNRIGLMEMGRVLEGIFRSLNNLLERFHQSFFFYLLPSTERYVSIGMYMMPLGVLVLPVLIKVITLWIITNTASEAEAENDLTDETETEQTMQKDDKEHTIKESKSTEETEAEKSVKVHKATKETDEEQMKNAQSYTILCYIPVISVALMFGLGLYHSPHYFISIARDMRLTAQEGLLLGFLSINTAAMLSPKILKASVGESMRQMNPMVLKCIALIAFGITLAGISVVNFSLAFFIAVLCIPVYLVASPTTSIVRRSVQCISLLLVSPAGLMFLTFILHLTLSIDIPSSGTQLVSVGWKSAQEGLLSLVVDAYLLNNWTFYVLSLVYFPVWIMFWLLLWCGSVD